MAPFCISQSSESFSAWFPHTLLRVMQPWSPSWSQQRRCWRARRAWSRLPALWPSTPKTPPSGRCWPDTPGLCLTPSRNSSPTWGKLYYATTAAPACTASTFSDRFRSHLLLWQNPCPSQWCDTSWHFSSCSSSTTCIASLLALLTGMQEGLSWGDWENVQNTCPYFWRGHVAWHHSIHMKQTQ